MAAIIIRDNANAKATWLTGLAGVRATACDMTQRAMAWAAAAILICAAVAALAQLAAELLSFPAPIAVTGTTLMAAALLHSLRRHLRRRRPGVGLARGTSTACSDKPASILRCAAYAQPNAAGEDVSAATHAEHPIVHCLNRIS